MFSPPTIRDDVNGLTILVKHASGEHRDQLRTQAKLLEAAAHLNVVKLRSLLELEDRSELMLEYVQGAPLSEQSPLSLAGLLDVVLQLGATLADLHALGIRHGAINAEHVLIDINGQVVLCGFGNAAFIAESTTGVGVGAGVGAVEDAAAFAALLSVELARSQDAGLTSLQRREVAEVQSVVSAITPSDAPDGAPGGAHGRSGRGLNAGLRAGDVFGSGLAHLDEIARTMQSGSWRAGNRQATNTRPGRRGWRSLSNINRRWLVAAGVVVASLLVWQVGFNDGGANGAGSADTDAANAGATPNAVTANGPQSAGSQPATTAGVTDDGQSSGVLVMGTTPERCLVDEPSDSPNSAAPAAPELATVTATITDLDINADGCFEHVRIGTFGTAAQPAIATDTHRWLVGQPGDTVIVGDWSCDGIATPAIVRPSSGEVFFFAVWPYTSPAAQPTFKAHVPTGASAAASIPATGQPTAGETGASQPTAGQPTTNQPCHDLAVSYGEQTLQLNPSRHRTAAELTPSS